MCVHVYAYIYIYKHYHTDTTIHTCIHIKAMGRKDHCVRVTVQLLGLAKILFHLIIDASSNILNLINEAGHVMVPVVMETAKESRFSSTLDP